MYTAVIEKRFEASHTVAGIVPEPHSHNWVIRLTLEAEALLHPGVIMDFFEVEKILEATLPKSGQTLNQQYPIEPTAENLSRYFYETLSLQLPALTAVSVGEFPEFMVTYKK